MDLSEAEDKVLEYFRQQGFIITEWPSLHPALEWRPRARVTRVVYGRTSAAAIVVRENGNSYKQPHNWRPLEEARRQLPSLSIFFAIPDNIRKEPLLQELQELGIGLYTIASDGILNKIQADRVPFDDVVISYPIKPNMPYRNRMNIYKVFSNCDEYLWWLDKHFRAEGFELIEDFCCHAGTTRINELKILGSNIPGKKEVKRLRSHFTQLQSELAGLNIQAEMRILTDAAILKNLHDRYIISKNRAFQMLPVGSLVKGQAGSLTLEENPVDFMQLWNVGVTV